MKLRFLPLILMLPLATLAAEPLRVTALKCENAVDPLGVDDPYPQLSWQVASDENDQRQTAWQVIAASSAELLAKDQHDLWDTGKISDQTTRIHFPGIPPSGISMPSIPPTARFTDTPSTGQQIFWKVRAWDRDDKPTEWSKPASWTMGVASPRDWNAKWIGAPWKATSMLLRRDFEVKPGLKRALLFVSGMGTCEASFNGGKVGSDLLSPGWTNYDATTLYDTHDVTSLLREGRNAAGLAVGRSMFQVDRPEGRFAKFIGSFGEIRAIAQLRLEYADGQIETVVTDGNWRANRGPVTFNSIFGGEDYDARLLPAGWTTAGFDDAAWEKALEKDWPVNTLRGLSHSAEPLRVIETHRPVAVRELASGAVLYDFGQNASFMPRLRVTGPAGSVVKLTPGEVVNADGTIERGTMGGAHRGSAWWQYTKATDGEESWFPQFYYVGSRYISAELMPAGEGGEKPRIVSLDAEVVHSTAEPIGKFACSNPLLNRIRDLVRWAQRSNMVSVLTDCPHREKLGWIEQYHLNGPSIRYEFDVNRIYAKGMNDMAEAQTPEGLVPNIAPEYTKFKGPFRDAAEWGAAFILVPWQQYEFTGDDSLLRKHYPAMKRYFAYLETQAQDNILSNGLGDWYDYELGKGKRADLTPAPITATAFFYEDARRMAAAAKLLKDEKDAARFTKRAAEIRAAYIKKFRREDGLYGTASQASLAIPLVMGLVEEADRAKVTAALVADVESKGYASAGDIGFRYLLLALMQAGRQDVIYNLINQDEKPGYGFQLKQGATALAESWHAALTASHNHFMLGQVIEWFYAGLVGIAPDPAVPGFKHILIRPTPVGDLTWAEGSYNSVHGPISVRWERQDGKFTLTATIPANTTATVQLPAPAGKKPETREIGSGTHRFETPL